MIPTHEIHVIADRHRIPGWKDYTISVDMLQPADAFSMSVRFTPEAWELLALDQLITVCVDSTKILTGYIDEREKVSEPGGGTMIQISGRDKTGRLVDESSPLFQYGGLRLRELAEKIVGLVDDDEPLFESVTLTNTRNRSLLRNVRARKAKVVREPIIDGIVGVFRPLAGTFGYQLGTVGRKIERPPIIDPGIFTGRARPRKVAPGSSRWSVLESFLREARLLAWSTGDGKELFIGLPNYDQQNQYMFFEAGADSSNRDDTNCAIRVRQTNAERYSRITAIGASKASGASYGKNVSKRIAVVFDNPENTTDGTGISFRRRKALIVSDDSIKSARDALERAEREKLERDANAVEVIVRAPGHSQLYSGEEPTLFAVDTMARVIDEDTSISADMLITSVEYRQSRDEGTTTELRLVPRGTLLQL
jgi:prophage tail gpP-like protein